MPRVGTSAITTSYDSQFDEGYFERGRTLGKSWYEGFVWQPSRSFAEALAAIGALEGPPGTYLDYGCAKGFLVKALKALERDAIGCDVSDYALEHCDPSVLGSLFRPEAISRVSDYGAVKDVLEHCQDLPKALAYLRHCARKWLLVVPLAENGRYRIPQYEFDITHRIREPESWWLRQIADSGMRIRWTGYALAGMKDKWLAAHEHGNLFIVADSSDRPAEPLDDLGAFYQCYQRPRAVSTVLKGFRQSYPDAPVYLVSDGGDDFSEIANSLSCRYERGENIGYGTRYGPRQHREWLRRLLTACDHCGTEWLIILEDDVLVRGKPSVPDYAIAGPDYSAMPGFYGTIGPALLNDIRSRHPHIQPLGYGGQGGTLLHAPTLRKAVGRFLVADSFDHMTSLTHPQFAAACDWVLTYIFQSAGYQYGPSPDVDRADWIGWEARGKPIVHLWKDNY